MNLFKRLFAKPKREISIKKGITYFHIEGYRESNYAAEIKQAFQRWNEALADVGYGFIELKSPKLANIQVKFYNAKRPLPDPWKSIMDDRDVISFQTPEPYIIYINTDICENYTECIFKSIGKMLYGGHDLAGEFKFAMNEKENIISDELLNDVKNGL